MHLLACLRTPLVLQAGEGAWLQMSILPRLQATSVALVPAPVAGQLSESGAVHMHRRGDKHACAPHKAHAHEESVVGGSLVAKVLVL